jgi:hypothetical protein
MADVNFGVDMNSGYKKSKLKTSDLRALAAVPRIAGSTDNRVSSNWKAQLCKDLKLSLRWLSYGCAGLKTAAFAENGLRQKCSSGEPHILNILWICSTFK